MLPRSETGDPRDAAPADVYDLEKPPLWRKAVSTLGIEVQGSEPVPTEQRTERRYLKLYTLWFSMNFNLIA